MIGKMSARKQAQGAIERITEIEEALPQIVSSMNSTVGTMQNQISHTTEIVDALVYLFGEDEVVQAIEVCRAAKAMKMADARKARVVAACEEGTLVGEETVRPCIKHADFEKMDPRDPARFLDLGSFIATVEYDSKGLELPGSYQCLLHATVNPEFQAALAGKKAGDEIEVPLKDGNGTPAVDAEGKPLIGKIAILAVYKQQPKPTQAATVKPAASKTPEQMASPTEGPVTDVQAPGVSEPQPEQAAPSAGA